MSDPYDKRAVDVAKEILRRSSAKPETMERARQVLREAVTASRAVKAPPAPPPDVAKAPPESELDLTVANALDKATPYLRAGVEGLQRGAFANLPRLIEGAGREVYSAGNQLFGGEALPEQQPDVFQQAYEEAPSAGGASQLLSSVSPIGVAGRGLNAIEKAAGVAAKGVSPAVSAVRGFVANALGGGTLRSVDQMVQPELRALSPEDRYKDLGMSMLGSGGIGAVANYGQTLIGRTPNALGSARAAFREKPGAGRTLAELEALDAGEITPMSLLTNAPVPGKAVGQAQREVAEAVAKGGGKIVSADPAEHFLHKASAAAMGVVESLRGKMAEVEADVAPRLESRLLSAKSSLEEIGASREHVVSQARAAAIAQAEALTARLQQAASHKDIAGAQAVVEELKRSFPEEAMQSIARSVDDDYRASSVASIEAAKALFPRLSAVRDDVLGGISQSRKGFEAADAERTSAALGSAAHAAGMADEALPKIGAIREHLGELAAGGEDAVQAARQTSVQPLLEKIAQIRAKNSLSGEPLPGGGAVTGALDTLESSLRALPEGVMTSNDAVGLIRQLSALGKESAGTFTPGTRHYEALAGATRQSVYGDVKMLGPIQELYSGMLQSLENMMFGVGLPSNTSRLDTRDMSQLSKSSSTLLAQYGKDPLVTEAVDMIAASRPASAGSKSAREALAEMVAARTRQEMLQGAGIQAPAPGVGGGFNADTLESTMRSAAMQPSTSRALTAIDLAKKSGADLERYGEVSSLASSVAGNADDAMLLRNQVAKYGQDPLLDAKLDKLSATVPGLRQSLDEAKALRGRLPDVAQAGQERAEMARFQVRAQTKKAQANVAEIEQAGVGRMSADTAMRRSFVYRDRQAAAMKQALRKSGVAPAAIEQYGNDVAQAYALGGPQAVLEHLAEGNPKVLEAIAGQLRQATRNGELGRHGSSDLLALIRGNPEIYEPLRMTYAMELLDKASNASKMGGGATLTSSGNLVSRISPHMGYRFEALRKMTGESESAVLVTVARQLYDIYKSHQAQQERRP